MFQKFRITFYSLIVLLVLVLPSQADAVELYADSCKGWDCSYEGQICPQGAEGAGGGNYICKNKRWMAMLADSCKGWDCSNEGQICPNGADGASGSDFICRNSKWVKALVIQNSNGKALCRDFNRYQKPVGVILPQVLKSTEYWFRECTSGPTNKNGHLIQLSDEECLVENNAQEALAVQCEKDF